MAVGACTKRDGTSPTPNAAPSHAHVAPHGGTLVELGDHVYVLEFVRDRNAGKLTAYLLDAHAENFIRTDAPAVALVVTVGGAEHALALQPVANSATGETAGNTSQFEAQADWLKGAAPVEGRLPSLQIHGRTFREITFRVP